MTGFIRRILGEAVTRAVSLAAACAPIVEAAGVESNRRLHRFLRSSCEFEQKSGAPFRQKAGILCPPEDDRSPLPFVRRTGRVIGRPIRTPPCGKPQAVKETQECHFELLLLLELALAFVEGVHQVAVADDPNSSVATALPDRGRQEKLHAALVPYGRNFKKQIRPTTLVSLREGARIEQTESMVLNGSSGFSTTPGGTAGSLCASGRRCRR